MVERYVDLLDGNQICSLRRIADLRKQRNLTASPTIPPELFGMLNIDVLSDDTVTGKGTGKAVLVDGLWVAESVPYTLQERVDQALNMRRRRYAEESDPLYFEAQYTGLTADDTAWRDKVAEIKAAHPIPTV